MLKVSAAPAVIFVTRIDKKHNLAPAIYKQHTISRNPYAQIKLPQSMNIHAIYDVIFRFWRQKRMQQFEKIIQPRAGETVLDVGGYPGTWTMRPQTVKSIECLNIHAVSWDPASHPNYAISTIIGDGCALDCKDNTYDIIFSNSVIEHVGGWENQMAFAREARRAGKRLWIQTPAMECPIEPHFLAPFVHWFPIFIRRRILRWFTPWGWMEKPTQKTVDETIAFTKLLNKKQIRELFPDCTIVTERLLGIFPKSYIAYRLHSNN